MNGHESHEALLDFKARQQSGEHLPCPRCGRRTMKPRLLTNARSRHADIYICDGCGTAEGVLAFKGMTLSLEEWVCLHPGRAPTDFKAMPGVLAAQIIASEQTGMLMAFHERCLENPSDFRALTDAAMESFPGLTAIQWQPFQAVYETADRTVRMRLSDQGFTIGLDPPSEKN